MTLQKLMDEFDGNGYLYSDAGNGCAFADEFLDYDDDAADQYGNLAMYPDNYIDHSGREYGWSSGWISTGIPWANPYRYQIRF